MKRLLGVAALAIVLVPGARAWTPVASPVEDTVIGLMTRAGTELVAWGTIDGVVVSRNGGPPGLAVAATGAGYRPGPFLQLGPRRVALYYRDSQTLVGRVESSDEGRTWTQPIVAITPPEVTVTSAVARAGGVPLFTGLTLEYRDDELWYPVAWEGDSDAPAWRGPVGTHATVAVDARDRAYVVYWTEPGVVIPGRESGIFSVRLGRGGAPAAPAQRLGQRGVVMDVVRGANGDAVAVVRQGNALPLRFVDLGTRRAVERALPRFAGFGLLAPLSDRRGRLWVVWNDGDLVSAVRADRVGARFKARTSTVIPHRLPLWNISWVLPLARADGTLTLYVVVDGRLLRHRLRLPRH